MSSPADSESNRAIGPDEGPEPDSALEEAKIELENCIKGYVNSYPELIDRLHVVYTQVLKEFPEKAQAAANQFQGTKRPYDEINGHITPPYNPRSYSEPRSKRVCLDNGSGQSRADSNPDHDDMDMRDEDENHSLYPTIDQRDNFQFNGHNASVDHHGDGTNVQIHGHNAYVSLHGHDTHVNVQGNNAHVKLQGNGVDVHIQGQNAYLSLHGDGAHVHVHGNNAHIILRQATNQVHIHGDNGRVDDATHRSFLPIRANRQRDRDESMARDPFLDRMTTRGYADTRDGYQDYLEQASAMSVVNGSGWSPMPMTRRHQFRENSESFYSDSSCRNGEISSHYHTYDRRFDSYRPSYELGGY
ncbi:hypothetical protein CC80DRAFT_571026 [Byssothecium circinans]|uniref:Uncharacterized protein n=1 Tax=Byssothecium circinans TaxID=147558 RepID=A0A6A5TQP4_9PLEO|nr:hypothetical protein CC80DRAFT_571026 [Byssothecium circinans]